MAAFTIFIASIYDYLWIAPTVAFATAATLLAIHLWRKHTRRVS